MKLDNEKIMPDELRSITTIDISNLDKLEKLLLLIQPDKATCQHATVTKQRTNVLETISKVNGNTIANLQHYEVYENFELDGYILSLQKLKMISNR